MLRDMVMPLIVLSVIAATATHGRRGMLLQVSVCIAAMLLDRWWLGALGVRPFGASEVAGAFAWALLFAVTGLLARSVMRTSAEVTHRRQEAFNAELARQNTALLVFDVATQAAVASLGGCERSCDKAKREQGSQY